MEKGTYVQITVILTALLLVTGTASAYFYAQYTQEVTVNGKNVAELKDLLSKYNSTITSNILIDFGNGTSHWYNNTLIQPGWNLYTATLVIADGNVNATCCEFNSHFVTGIEGIQNKPGQNKGWLIWTYNFTSSWQTAEVGADQLMMFNGSVYAWTFCAYDPNTGAPFCKPS